eukprot:16700-Pelagococcus_subviridis.AAC.1
MAATREIVDIAEAWGVTPTELSLAWAIGRPCNASVIIGTTTTRQVEVRLLPIRPRSRGAR